MRVILLSVGSRGDTEPYCALAQQLLQRHPGIQVDMFVQFNLQKHADPFRGHPDFRFFTFPFESDDFYKVAGTSSVLGRSPHPDPRMKHVETVAKIVGGLILPCLPQVLKVVDDPEKSQDCIVVTSAFTRSLAFLLARERKISVILLHLQPLLPNRIFPSYRTSRMRFVHACMEGTLKNTTANQEEFEESYWKLEHALEVFFLNDRLERIGSECFGENFSPPSWEDLQAILTGKDKLVWIVNAYSHHLVPSLAGSPGMGSQVLDVGPLADGYVPKEQEELDQSLQNFLDSASKNDNEKPICIGFGSMPFHDVGVILQAVKALKVRVVLVGDTFLRIHESHPAIRYDRIVCVSAAAYSLLLQRCSMMICHGGMGVVQACLRAGVPCLISPLMGDQFALAKLVEAKGYGVQCGSRLSELSVEDVIRAVDAGRKCSDSCRELGLKIRKERPSAVERLADWMVETMNSSSREDKCKT